MLVTYNYIRLQIYFKQNKISTEFDKIAGYKWSVQPITHFELRLFL